MDGEATVKTIVAEESAEVGADAVTAYAILADYHEGHPSILPPRWFTGLSVEEGGRGEGTVIRFGMKAMGRVSEARARVSEPEPGRVLREALLDDRGYVTTFSVDPLGEDRSRVTIRTEWPGRRGIAGWVDNRLTPPLLRRIYRDELVLLDRVAQAKRSR